MVSKGELNKMVDDLVHPAAQGNPALWLLDGILHAMVEYNPDELRRWLDYITTVAAGNAAAPPAIPQSLKKWLRFDLDKLIEGCIRCLKPKG